MWPKFYNVFKYLFFFQLLLVSSSTLSQEPPKKNQFDSIFIWKISDELKLSVQEEKKFTEIFQKLSQKKNELLKSQQNIMTEIELSQNSAKNEAKQQAALLKKYRLNLEQVNKISLDEFDQVKMLFGDQKMLRYLKVKNEVTNKLKNTLVNEIPAVKEKKLNLPIPKIIERD